jgi:hypothetical protein
MVVPEPLVNVPKETFFALENNDMIVVLNSSHILHRASDVRYLYLDIIPKLNAGVHLYLSEIYFPYENYPIELSTRKLQFPAEDYLLQSFLMHNSNYIVAWSGNYMVNQFSAEINATLSQETNATVPLLMSNSFIMSKIK